jgi:hypothetical protein
MRRFCLFAAAAALVLAPGSARAQASGRDAVMEHLQDVVAEAAGNGYRASPRVFDTRSVMGMLPRGASVVLEANLRAGVRYTVVAVCDGECVDLDLRAQTPDGAALDEDVAADDVPVLAFTATTDGPHPLTVIMSECRAELCRFGLRVLSR